MRHKTTNVQKMKYTSAFVVVLSIALGAVVESHEEENHKMIRRLRNHDGATDKNKQIETLKDMLVLEWDKVLADDERMDTLIMSMSMSMDYEDKSSCVPPDVPEFVIDDNVNIGDTLFHPGPGFARKCGSDCYTVKDSGDDPDFDPELGDTLRFAYKRVSSNNFSIRSRVCGTVCDGNDGYSGQFGRTGLMVRESLDPLARNIYASHSPNGQADWSYRTEPGALWVFGADGSPDVPCLWITLERAANQFTFSYAYEGGDDKHSCELDDVLDLTQTVTIEMPKDVFVGLGVSTAVAPPYCQYTEADFKDIECRGC